MEIKDLMVFCQSGRGGLGAPFVVDGKTYATDGRTLIRYEGILEDAQDANPNISAHRGAATLAFPALDEKDIKYTFDAPIATDTACPHCGQKWNKEPNITDKAIRVGDKLLNPCYLYRIMQLPGFRFVDRPGKLEPQPFRFDGGDGLLMPIIGAN